MIKKTLISLVFLVLLLVGGLFFYIDGIVKSGIEVAGSSVLGTAVTVRSVSISPLNGSGSISGLQVANVEGYSADNALTLEEISIQLDVASLFSDAIEISSINVVQPQITYETRITTDNIRDLMANLPEGGGETSDTATSDSSGPGLVIREFNMLDPQVNLVAAVIEAPVPLPDIRLTDIGEQDQTATAAEVARTVLGALRQSLLNADLPGLDALRENVEGRLQEGLETLEEGVEEVKSRLQNILN